MTQIKSTEDDYLQGSHESKSDQNLQGIWCII